VLPALSTNLQWTGKVHTLQLWHWCSYQCDKLPSPFHFSNLCARHIGVQKANAQCSLVTICDVSCSQSSFALWSIQNVHEFQYSCAGNTLLFLPTKRFEERDPKVMENTLKAYKCVYKVDDPYLVTFLIRTPIFELYVLWWGSKNGYQKDMSLREIGLPAKIIWYPF
jgi:hypothetical protein